MINLALLASFVFLGQNPATNQVPAKVLGQDLVVEFPVGGTFNPQTPHFELNEWKVETRSDGSIGQRYLVDGGWGDFKLQFDKTGAVTEKRPYRVKVLVVPYATIVETSTLGIVRQRRASIDEDEIKTIARGLGTFKGMVEGTSHGKLNVQFETSIDNDLVIASESPETIRAQVLRTVSTSSPNLSNEPFGESYLAQDIAPQINDDKFDADDGIYRGPFDSVFVIHAGLCAPHTARVGRTSVTTLPYFAGQSAGYGDLAQRLYDSWVGQVEMLASGLDQVPLKTRVSRPKFPLIRGGAYFDSLLQTALSSNGLFEGGGWSQGDVPPNAVPYESADVVASKLSLPSTQPVKWWASASGPQVEFVGVTRDQIEKVKFVASGQDFDERSPLPVVVGEYECVVTTSADGIKTYDVKQKGSISRGYVTLSRASDLVPKGSALNLNFKAKLSSDENLSLGLYSNGLKVGSLLLGGDTPGPNEKTSSFQIVDVSVPGDDQWHQVSVPLAPFVQTKPLTEIRVEAPWNGRYERLNRATVSLGISNLETGAPIVTESATNSGAKELEQLAELKGEVTSDQATFLLSRLKSNSPTVKLTALSALGRIKLPEAVAVLNDLSQSLSAPVSMLAVKALAFQDTPEAWASLRLTVERGTFEHSKRFAAKEFFGRPDPGMAASLNFLTVRSRHARFEAVRALSQIKTTSATIILASVLRFEPDPMIRVEIARLGDSTVDLMAKGLLYAAVNDSSQNVRSECYSKLIDTPQKEFQAEALKGVRDEALGVRLSLLETMRIRANESYRPALRLAVTDSSAAVRAAALRAFATQPGPVDPNEVKNVFTDTNETVRKALNDLAAAKGFKVPNP